MLKVEMLRDKIQRLVREGMSPAQIAEECSCHEDSPFVRDEYNKALQMTFEELTCELS